MRQPDFMIAGAPKCGTTALYEYLLSHPQIFLTDPKEPHYFAEDLGAHRSVFSREEYDQLFAGATDQHQCVGEASVWSLHSSIALEKVKQELPNIRLVILLRQPVDFLVSLHSDMVWVCFDDEPDFEAAWELQEVRRLGRRIPRLCQVPWFLDYRSLGQLSRYVSRLQKLFAPEQIKIMLFDDLKESPRKVYEQTLEFLGLESDGRTEFPRVNAGKRNRSSWLARFRSTVVQSLPRPVIRMGKAVGLGQVSRGLMHLNSKPAGPVRIRPQFREQLIAEFSDDIDALSQLIKRDLRNWKAAK